MTIERHRTAISRMDLSRPVRIALESELLGSHETFFDYGCGRGDDLRQLQASGVEAEGWDPAHRPDVKPRAADVVNLGYVVNVVEDPAERLEAVRRAWDLSEKVLVVSARLTMEAKDAAFEEHGDGVRTQRNTFQKFFTQSELREWLDETLGQECVAAAPGVFFVFRDSEQRESYISSRYRRRRAAPRVRKSDQMFEAHKDLLDPLLQFLAQRGRLPGEGELAGTSEIEEAFGSLRKAYHVIRLVTGVGEWEAIRRERTEELRIQFALDRFRGRPKLSDLPVDIQLDIREFFSNYKKACADADELLFSVGSPEQIAEAVDNSDHGKVTGNSLYVHVDALHELDPILRTYEGCAREFAGIVEEANVLKMHRWVPKISYLEYPTFDKDPHPGLWKSTIVSLREREIGRRVYGESPNPPILHRKETLLAAADERRAKFEKLTAQEERAGLFEEPDRIGRRAGWEELLVEKGVRLRGHRLVKR